MQAPTPSQLAAIRAANEHVLVAAGAGTGKTSTVVGRVLYLLGVPVAGLTIERPLELRDIAAITYTNAAAADLKRKLRQELQAAGRRREAYDLDSARIGTIHAFCGALLREFALRAGGNPSARVLEEGEASALVAEAVHETLLRVLEEGSLPGLTELFARFEVKKVKEWAKALAGDRARLDRYLAQRTGYDPPTRALVDLADRIEREVERRLRAAGAMDFDHMILWTRTLLARDSIRRTLQRRIRTLIVDEFQDVDPVQRDIAYAFGAPEERRGDTTRLMLVGDPKQSIYRFRRADVTVWTSVERDFAAGLGRLITLEENFRSVPAIVAFTDASVGAVLDRPLQPGAWADYEVHHQPLQASRDGSAPTPPGSKRAGRASAAAASDAAVELITLTGAGDSRVEGCRQAEAAAIARRMTELVAGGARYRDMAILLTGWGALDIYQGTLRAAGIPTYALLSEGFYERREVWDLLLALETFRDPRDDRALLGFLRSPFVGVRDETLLDIVRQADRNVWRRIRSVTVEEQSLLQYGIELIDEHVRLRDRVPIDELLQSLLEQSGYLGHLVALGDSGRQPLANVRKFLRLAREFRDGNVGDFLRASREAKKREEPEPDERLYGQHEDVVTITSVHSAKGLQWPIVFWADLARGPRNTGGDVLIGRETIAVKDPDAEAQGEAWDALIELERREAAAEAKRLWYVAATRAQDRLILSGFTDAKASAKETMASGALGAVLGLAGVAGGTVVYTDASGRQFSALVHQVAMGDEEPVATEEIFAPAPVPSPRAAITVRAGRSRHSATELMTQARCARRHWFKYVVGVREPAVERDGPEWGGAIARGLVVHDVLEHIREEAELAELLEAAIGRWDPASPAPEAEPGRKYRDDLAREIAAVRTHPGYRALDEAPGRRRELEFMHLITADGVLQGKIDLAAPAGDGLAALDVKTGGGDPAALRRKAEGYALQRAVYIGALEALSGRPVTSFAFQFASDGVHVGGEVTDDMRRTAADQVAAALSAMGTDAPALTSFPVECRFCGYRRVRWCEGVAAAPLAGADRSSA